MFRDLMNYNIEGSEVFKIISLLLFVVVFVVVTIYVLTASKDYFIKMKNIPFDNTADGAEKGDNHVS